MDIDLPPSARLGSAAVRLTSPAGAESALVCGILAVEVSCATFASQCSRWAPHTRPSCAERLHLLVPPANLTDPSPPATATATAAAADSAREIAWKHTTTVCMYVG